MCNHRWPFPPVGFICFRAVLPVSELRMGCHSNGFVGKETFFKKSLSRFQVLHVGYNKKTP